MNDMNAPSPKRGVIRWHLVWATKYRSPVLSGEVAVRLEELVREKCFEKEWKLEDISVNSDHVEVFVETSPVVSGSHVAQQMKSATSRKLREEFPHLRSRLPSLWSRTMYVGTIGSVSRLRIRQYLADEPTRQ